MRLVFADTLYRGAILHPLDQYRAQVIRAWEELGFSKGRSRTCSSIFAARSNRHEGGSGEAEARPVPRGGATMMMKGGTTMAHSLRLRLEYWKDGKWLVSQSSQVPGVFSQGATLDELEDNIRDAYRMMLEEQTQASAATPVETKEIELPA